jgi:regulator of extracellular matrix RemA (YlzA/DUF370 family)
METTSDAAWVNAYARLLMRAVGISQGDAERHGQPHFAFEGKRTTGVVRVYDEQHVILSIAVPPHVALRICDMINTEERDEG